MIDHLIVVARTLDEGEACIRERLGATMAPGGKHPTMGTHNRLLSLGADAFLEVMAIDPEAAKPKQPRWLGLDEPETQALIAKGPTLLHWMARTNDIDAAVQASGEDLEIVAFTRGVNRWRLALTRDGSLPGGGLRPTLIQWETTHPATSLPASGVRLVELGAPGRGPARFATATGERSLPWRVPGLAE